MKLFVTIIVLLCALALIVVVAFDAEPYCFIDKPGARMAPECIDSWTFGAPTSPAGYFDVLKNGQSVQGAKASKIALCRGTVYVLGRDKFWWRWLGTWQNTRSATLPCEGP